MESFRTRTLSSGEDVSEIISRTPEHANRNSHSNHKGIDNFPSLWSGFTVHTRADDSDEHSVKKKTLRDHSYIYTFLSTVLFTVTLIVEKIFHFKLFESSHASIFFFWLESCSIALFFRFWGRKRIRSFRSQARHFFPMLSLHVVTVTAFSVDFNSSNFKVSGGSAAYMLSLALTPAMVLLASWQTSRQCYSDRILIFVVILCSLLVILFCSLEDSPAEYKVSFRDGVFALMMSASLAFFTVHAKRFLPKASSPELLYLLNFSCVVCLPFIALLFGEFPALEQEVLQRGMVNVIFCVFIVAVLRLASQAALLYQLKFSSPLLSTNTQGFAWIWITIAITFLTVADKGELMMPVFAAFWLYGLFLFLPALFSDLQWI